MRYLFLDIDGVVNSEDFYQAYFGKKGDEERLRRCFPDIGKYAGKNICRHIDKKAVEYIDRIVNETGACVILSSSWRLDERIHEDLELVGISISGKTPSLIWQYGTSLCRGKEISKFLETHPCSSYAILDDDDDMEPEQISHFVRTDPRFGITEQDADRVIEILKDYSDTSQVTC